VYEKEYVKSIVWIVDWMFHVISFI